MTQRPFRFALSVNRLHESTKDWLRSLQMADDLGLSQVVLGDHVGEQRYASVLALASGASVNGRLRFGTSVFNNDFRHPVISAKDVATLDVMSEGRVELGLGARRVAPDYGTTGSIRDSGRIRIERLEESVQIIRGLLGSGPVTFEESAGDRIGPIELKILVHAVSAAHDPQTGAEQLASGFGLSVAEALESPYLLIGPIAKIADDVMSLRASLGLSYFTVRYADAEAFAPVVEILSGG